MGRYKSYREPKRRSYEDNNFSNDRTDDAAPNYHSISVRPASAPVDAVVKWFNAVKGFGFVALVGGSEAFIHIRQVEAVGHSSLPEGARVKLRIGPGQKGPEVTEIVEIDVSTAQSLPKRRPTAPSQVLGQVTESSALSSRTRPTRGSVLSSGMAGRRMFSFTSPHLHGPG